MVGEAVLPPGKVQATLELKVLDTCLPVESDAGLNRARFVMILHVASSRAEFPDDSSIWHDVGFPAASIISSYVTEP